jgi:hypothetical protein
MRGIAAQARAGIQGSFDLSSFKQARVSMHLPDHRRRRLRAHDSDGGPRTDDDLRGDDKAGLPDPPRAALDGQDGQGVGVFQV